MDFSSKFLIYITGPIGAGKTTILPLVFRSFPMSNIELISADLFYYLYFQDKATPVGVSYSHAKEYCMHKIIKKIENNESFVWETVFAKPDKFRILDMCHAKRYNIMGIFVGVDSESLLQYRVKKRTEEGWYDIPSEKVIDRYHAIMANLPVLYNSTSTFIAIDSSNIQYNIVLIKIDNHTAYCSDSCHWLTTACPII